MECGLLILYLIVIGLVIGAIENAVERHRERALEQAVREVLGDFDIEKAKTRILAINPENSFALPDERCPDCLGVLVDREGDYGPFLGCSNYPRCTFTEDVLL